LKANHVGGALNDGHQPTGHDHRPSGPGQTALPPIGPDQLQAREAFAFGPVKQQFGPGSFGDMGWMDIDSQQQA
jgi:hypothetical protein